MSDQSEADFSSAKSVALAALDDGRPKDAFHLLKPILRYGYEYKSEAEFLAAFETFAKIAREIAGDELADLVTAVVSSPREVESLYKLGHALVEHRLPGIAANILQIANIVHPKIPGVISELVTALEQDGNTQAAVELLEETPDLVEHDFLLGYLLGFNALLSGDLQKSRQAASMLKPDPNNAHQLHMFETLATMHSRADAVSEATWLDDTDLRGWHYVINGGLLTHLSPHGFPDPMNGRYAFLNDTNENVLGGMQLLKEVTRRKEFPVERIFSLPDRDSEILAQIAARYFSVDVIPLEASESRSGVIACYTPEKLGQEAIQSIRDHRPGQLLYTHALNWTELTPVTGDVATLLYQTIFSPWQVGVAMGENEQLLETPADDRDPSVIAEEVIQLELSEDFAREPHPEQFERLINAIELPRAEGRRSLMWENSPVSSSRFL